MGVARRASCVMRIAYKTNNKRNTQYDIRNTIMAGKRTRVWVPKRNKMRLGFLSKRMLFTWFMLGGLIFLFAPQDLTNKFQFAFARTFSWPLGIGRSVTLAARTPASTEPVSRREYDRLQNHLANVIQRRDQAYQEIEKLSGLKKRLPFEDAKLVLAGIITASIDESRHEFIIDRGTEDGLAKEQFVLGDNSIIGTISDASARRAKVRLFTDPASHIAIKIAGLDVSRLMQGTGDKAAKIRLLQIKHKVKTGDTVYACKKPGFLDAPMIVGKVAQCKIDDENPSLLDITVRPVCDIEMLNDVAIVVMNPRQ